MVSTANKKRVKNQGFLLSEVSKYIDALPHNITCSSCEESFCCEQQNEIDVGKKEFELLSFHITDDILINAKREVASYHLTGRFTCPFLVKSKCSVYSLRPITCGMHIVVSPVVYCDTKKGIRNTASLSKPEMFLEMSLSNHKFKKEASNLLVDGHQNMIKHFIDYIEKHSLG